MDCAARFFDPKLQRSLAQEPTRNPIPRPFRHLVSQRLSSVALFCVVVSMVAMGCGRIGKQSADSASATAKPIRGEAKDGPVNVTLEASNGEIRLSDDIKLTVEIDSEPGVAITKPTLGATIGEFTVTGVREPLPSVENGKHRVRQVFTLEPNSIGELKIPPILVNYEDKRDAAKPISGKVETQPLTIQVTSSIAKDNPSLAQLESASAPVALPSPPLGPLGWSLIGLSVAAGIGLLYGVKRFLDREVIVRSLTPSELAAQEFEQLEKKNWIATDIKLFYVELTAIVRRYIERTTNISAPDQTTDEFLRATTGHPSFSSVERQRLQDFLESADLVKFAAYQPSGQAVQASLHRAKVYVGLSHSEEGVAAA